MSFRSTLAAAAALCLTAGATLAESPGTASTAVSNGGVTPYIIAGAGEGGNRTCAEVGQAFFGDPNYFTQSSARINYNQDTNEFGASFPSGLTVSVTDDTYVGFSSTFPIGAVIVKGGDDANIYVYTPQASSDSGLTSPPNSSGGYANLSNITFCWNVVEASEWCSPGYWRQSQHAASWAPTGISWTQKYNSFFEPDLTGDPTLWQVLQSPQIYGGRAFNNVGDLLSANHPDINFTGERVEDSCPLN